MKYTSSCSVRRVVGGLVASLALVAVGCGSDPAPVESASVQAQVALDQGFGAFHQALGLMGQAEQAATEGDRAALQAAAQLQLRSALSSVEQSIDLSPTQQAELVRVFLQIGLGQLTWAQLSLELIDTNYPGTQDEFVHALLLSKQGGDPARILADLQASLADSWSGMEEAAWWNTIELSPDFESFRATPEYAQLQALKLPVVSRLARVQATAATTCHQDVTKVKAQWYGMQYLFKHDDVHTLLDTTTGLSLLSSILPLGLDVVFGAFFSVEGDAIRAADHGCGIIVTNVWLTPIYVPSPQD